MSSPYQILIRTDQDASAVQAELTHALRAAHGRVGVVRPADAEDAQDGRQFFDIEPTVNAFVKPVQGQEGAMFIALLSWAQSRRADLVVLLDYELVAAYRQGVLTAPTEERGFFDREVRPRWTGRVSWG